MYLGAIVRLSVVHSSMDGYSSCGGAKTYCLVLVGFPLTVSVARCFVLSSCARAWVCRMTEWICMRRKVYSPCLSK